MIFIFIFSFFYNDFYFDKEVLIFLIESKNQKQMFKKIVKKQARKTKIDIINKWVLGENSCWTYAF